MLGPVWARLWLSISALPGKASEQILQENFLAVVAAAVEEDGGGEGTTRPKAFVAGRGGEVEAGGPRPSAGVTPALRALAGEGGAGGPSLPIGCPPHCNMGHLVPGSGVSEAPGPEKETPPSVLSCGEKKGDSEGSYGTEMCLTCKRRRREQRQSRDRETGLD